MAKTERHFPEPGHDHSACLSGGLGRAEARCAENGARLTPQRREVLALLLAEHAALGAYEILDRIEWQGRKPAPVVVYRALEFLMEQGLVHKIASRNAFIACGHVGDEHGAQFLICDACGQVAEITSELVGAAVADVARDAGFRVVAPVIEVNGTCPHCAESPDA